MFHSRQNINDHKNHKIYAMLRKENRENKENQNNNMEVQQKIHNKNRSKDNNILIEQNYSSLIS